MSYCTKKMLISFVLLSIFRVGYLESRLIEVNTSDDFEKTLKENKTMVVLFFDMFKELGNTAVTNKIEKSVDDFKKISEISQYDEAGLDFLLVDLTGHPCHSYIMRLIRDSIPFYAIMVDGNFLKRSDGAIKHIHGFLVPEKVYMFIANNLTRDLTPKTRVLSRVKYDFTGLPLAPAGSGHKRQKNLYYPQTFWGGVWGPNFP